MTRAERIELAARELIAALDRQYGGPPLSLNSSEALAALRALLPPERDEADAVKPHEAAA
jgi:hypothetical protein